MKTYGKHIVILFLLLLAAAPFIAPVMLYVHQQLVIHEMKEKLEKETLHTIRVNQDIMEWTVTGKECLINGRMFDVKSIVQDGRYLLLTGLYDDEETSIISRLVTTASDAQKETNRATIIFVFTHLQAEENPETLIPVFLPFIQPGFQDFLAAKQLSAHTSLHSPPPDC
jgi:hypothetical protein